MRLPAVLGRIRTRLLLVNLVVLLVPAAGIEFARIYERQLLASFERDMRDQALLVGATLESGLDDQQSLRDNRTQAILVAAARRTRTRIRILDGGGETVLDSHSEGPPEGPEPPAPSLLPESLPTERIRGRPPIDDAAARELWTARSLPHQRWPTVARRREVRSALAGHPDAYTRIRARAPAVFLFVSEPVRHEGEVVGVVYVTRSTRPVLVELYKIRTGLLEVLAIALLFTLLLTALLAWSISRPLARLSRAARRIASGERGVAVPVAGSGEVRELGEAFSVMTDRLDARMRYTREFAADVGHELKSPLTSIRGAAELLRDGAAEEADTRARFSENILLDAERLERLVERLLELSRIDSSDAPIVEFDLAAMVDRIHARTHSDETPIRLRWETSLRRWRGRVGDLERALLNLVENAQRVSPPGVAVEVNVALEEQGRWLALSVRDRGPGVPAQLHAKVFERFFTTDGEEGGTGLGLSIVQSVSEAHRGRVDLTTREGEGATFTMRLPRDP